MGECFFISGSMVSFHIHFFWNKVEVVILGAKPRNVIGYGGVYETIFSINPKKQGLKVRNIFKHTGLSALS